MDVLEFLRLVEEECGGMRVQLYKDACDSGQRFGQAFVNALYNTPYYGKLLTPSYDPYYRTDYDSVRRDIDFLCAK